MITDKFKLLLFFCLVITTQISAQDQNRPSIFANGIQGCYSDYYITFHERGAKEATDGEHEAVLIFINNGNSRCYLAKATVKDGEIIPPVHIQKEDGAYVPVSTFFKALDKSWLEAQESSSIYAVTDGMSQIFKTQDGYFVRLFFQSLLQPDHGGNKLAPKASELDE